MSTSRSALVKYNGELRRADAMEQTPCEHVVTAVRPGAK